MPASAQELSGTVAVEGEFDPMVIETERLGEYPLTYRFELPQISLNYDVEGKTTDFAPSLLTMGVTGWNTLRSSAPPRGYLDLRVGSYLNSRLDGAVWLLRDSVNTLSADLNYRSTSLFKTHGIPAGFSSPQRRRLYDGTLGLNYSRRIGNDGLFATRLDYRLGYFNYYDCETERKSQQATAGAQASDAGTPRVPDQTVNQVNFKVGYNSSPSLLRGWHAGAELGYTAYRRFIYPDYVLDNQTKGDRETRLGINGGYAFSLGRGSAFAIDADADLLFYADRQLQLQGFEGDWRKDYGLISITPAYRLQKGSLWFQAGLDLDFAFGAMGVDHGKDFGAFHVAPDIRLDWRMSQFGLYVAATGGVTPVTLAGLEKYDLYQLPVLMSTCPVYSPLDARLGLCFGPYAGFSADLEVRYAIAKGTPTGGWYQYILGTYTGAFGSWKDYGEPEMTYGPSYGYRINLHGLSLDLNLRYKIEGVVEASLKGNFTPQNGRLGIFNGFDRPRFLLDADVAVYPMSRLRVEADYSLRALRAVYGMFETDNGNGQHLRSLHLPNLSLLSAKVSYRIFDTFDIYILAENLLNRRVDFLPGLQTNGIAFSGGIYWEF